MPSSFSTYLLYPNCWKLFEAMSPKSLAFRSAANTSVAESLRPLSGRVLRRVYELSDFRGLFLRVLLESTGTLTGFPRTPPFAGNQFEPAPRPLPSLGTLEDHLLSLEPGSLSEITEKLIWEIQRKLTQTPAFSVLLLEANRDSNSWADLLSMDSGFKEWRKSLFDKCFSKEHPAARTATAAFGGSLGFLLGAQIVLTIVPTLEHADLRLPLDVKLENAKLELGLKPSDEPLSTKMKVTLTPDPNNPEFALKLKASEPLKVDFQPKGTVKVKTEFLPSDKTLNTKLSVSSAPCCCCAQKTSGESEARGIKEEMATFESRLLSLQKKLEQNQSEDSSLSQKFGTLSKQITHAESQFMVADRDFSNVLATTSVTIPENGNGTVFLQWAEGEGLTKSCSANIKVSRDTAAYRVLLSSSDCPDSKLKNAINGSEMQFHLNEPQPIPPVPFHLTLTEAVHRHWWQWSGSHVTFRFQPDAHHFVTADLEKDRQQTAKVDSSNAKSLVSEQK